MVLSELVEAKLKKAEDGCQKRQQTVTGMKFLDIPRHLILVQTRHAQRGSRLETEV